MKHLQLIFITALAGALLAGVGCSTKESEPAPPPPATTTIEKTEPLSPKPATPSATANAKTAQPVMPAGIAATNSPAEEETPAQLAAQVKQLEKDYKNAPDLQKRVSIIFDLTAVDSPDTVDAVGRLLGSEKDQELKIELIDSLNDIDGQNDKKLAILSGALRPDQPKDVRLEAIDAMGDVEDKRGIQVLQVYAADSDEDVRDAIKDTTEQLQALTADP